MKESSNQYDPGYGLGKEYAQRAARGDVEIAKIDCRLSFDGEEKGGREIGYANDAGAPFGGVRREAAHQRSAKAIHVTM